MSPPSDAPGCAHWWAQQPVPTWLALLAVWVGGGMGGVSRYGIESAWSHPPGALPYATLAINVVGSGLMGALLAGRWTQTRAWPLISRLAGVGFLGGFTTLSSYSLQAFELLQLGHAWLAAAYLVGTVILGVLAAWGGWVVARRLWSLASVSRVD